MTVESTTTRAHGKITTMTSPRLRQMMDNLRQSTEYADMIISAQGRDIAAHKAIVCPQSAFFAVALHNGFKVWRLLNEQAQQVNIVIIKETHTSRIELPEDYDTIRILLDFCYLQDYRVNRGFRESIDQQLRLYVAADKYGILVLRDYTRTWIAYWLRAQYGKWIFPNKVRDVWYAIPPHEKILRDQVIDLVERHLDAFLKEEPKLEFLTGAPELPVSILRHVNDGTDRINNDDTDQIYKSYGCGIL